MEKSNQAIDAQVMAYVRQAGPVLCVDIGSGTQDAVLALSDEQPENWPRFVLPSPAQSVARRIAKVQDKGIWLHGTNMGGGFAEAVLCHIKKGFLVAATSVASAALHDSIDKVKAMGVEIAESCPQGFVPIELCDYDAHFWERFLQLADLPLPQTVLAAVQDHGYHGSAYGNREGRFMMWRELLHNPHPETWLFAKPQEQLTRLSALARATGGLVADTGTAAVLGALATPEVQERSFRQGVTIVNVGNSHVVAFLVFRGKVWGVYEHHTGMHDSASLVHDLQEFRLGWLPDEVVRAKGGHGTVFTGTLPEEAEGFMPTFVVGPQRECLRGHGQFIAPYGDMMFTGCHGLVYGAALTGC